MTITTQKLSEMIALGTNMYILDATIPMPKPDAPPSMLPSYFQARIPNASWFDINTIKDHANEMPHMFPDQPTWISYMKKLRIKNHDWPIVCYD
jgi:3-mercaptopyruvate sulfurtransferase SseA